MTQIVHVRVSNDLSIESGLPVVARMSMARSFKVLRSRVSFWCLGQF